MFFHRAYFVGCVDGKAVGKEVGLFEGRAVGAVLGMEDGVAVGAFVGKVVGAVGATEGVNVGTCRHFALPACEYAAGPQAVHATADAFANFPAGHETHLCFRFAKWRYFPGRQPWHPVAFDTHR